MTRHLGMQVSAYVDRRLDASALRAFDQHLVVCLVCRHAAEEERRLLTSLRSTPGCSPDLQSMLLALAQPAETRPAETNERAPAQAFVMPSRSSRTSLSFRPFTGVPPIPRAPDAVRQLRVPTVPPAGPALHRSPRRAALVAGLAASASAAAAIGLSVVGPGPGAAATVRATEPRLPASAAVSAVPAVFSGLGFGVSPLRSALGRPGR